MGPEYATDFIAKPSVLREHYGISAADWRKWKLCPGFPKAEPGLNKWETDDIDAWRAKHKGMPAPRPVQVQDAPEDEAVAWAARFAERLK